VQPVGSHGFFVSGPISLPQKVVEKFYICNLKEEAVTSFFHIITFFTA
jgi:hypothetical protein